MEYLLKAPFERQFDDSESLFFAFFVSDSASQKRSLPGQLSDDPTGVGLLSGSLLQTALPVCNSSCSPAAIRVPSARISRQPQSAAGLCAERHLTSSILPDSTRLVVSQFSESINLRLQPVSVSSPDQAVPPVPGSRSSLAGLFTGHAHRSEVAEEQR